MSWAVGYDSRQGRDIGYGVPAGCDHPDCAEKIDRGLGYVCGSEPHGGDHGCGLYFCEGHLAGRVEYDGWDGKRYASACERCEAGAPAFTPKPDLQEWTDFKMTDPSWAQWRAEQPQLSKEQPNGCRDG